MADLVVDSGKHRGRSVKLNAGETLVGRDRDCAIRLGTAEISRKHCRLVVSAGEGGTEAITVEDLKSRNGTFVNGHAISKTTALKPGDRLRVGPLQLLLPDKNAPTDSEVINWLVPPPAPGTVSDDDPTKVAGMSALDAGDAPPARPQRASADPFVKEAGDVIRCRHAALVG